MRKIKHPRGPYKKPEAKEPKGRIKLWLCKCDHLEDEKHNLYFYVEWKSEEQGVALTKIFQSIDSDQYQPYSQMLFMHQPRTKKEKLICHSRMKTIPTSIEVLNRIVDGRYE